MMRSGLDFLRKVSTLRHELPYSPELLQSLFAQTSDASLAPAAEVAKTIGNDQGLTSRILALANSAFYGLQSQVSSVQRAILVLGMREVRTLALALGFQSLTRKNSLPDDFDLAEYWTHQVLVASVAKKLAEDSPDLDPDNMFTAGILHDVGKLIIAMYAPNDWHEITRLRREEGLRPTIAEERVLGVDHGVAGALVLKSWHLPESLVEPINWHHNPNAPHLPEAVREAAVLLNMADSAVYSAASQGVDCLPEDEPPDMPPGVTPQNVCRAALAALEDDTISSLVEIMTT